MLWARLRRETSLIEIGETSMRCRRDLRRAALASRVLQCDLFALPPAEDHPGPAVWRALPEGTRRSLTENRLLVLVRREGQLLSRKRPQLGKIGTVRVGRAAVIQNVLADRLDEVRAAVIAPSGSSLRRSKAFCHAA